MRLPRYPCGSEYGTIYGTPHHIHFARTKYAVALGSDTIASRSRSDLVRPDISRPRISRIAQLKLRTQVIYRAH